MADETTTTTTAPVSENKQFWASKTMWMSLIVAVAPICPPLNAIISAHPELVSLVVGGIFAGLRMMTTKKISIPKATNA